MSTKAKPPKGHVALWSTIVEDQQIDDYVVTLTMRSDGHLECNYKASGHNIWCDHIADFYRSGHDAHYIWEYISAQPTSGPNVTYLQVPMVMAANVFQRVRLQCFTMASDKFNASEIQFDDVELIDLPTTETDLGIISVGDGIESIRASIKGAMESFWLVEGDPQCKQSVHGFAEQARWEEDRDRSPGRWFQQRFCAQRLHSCMECLISKNAADDIWNNI